MTHFRGDNLYVTFGGTVVSGDQRAVEVSENIDLIDVSAGADVNRTYITSLKDATASMEVLDSTDGTAATYITNVLTLGAEGTLVIGPEGTATGKPRRSQNVFVSNRAPSYPYDGEVVWTFEFQGSGAVTWDVYS